MKQSIHVYKICLVYFLVLPIKPKLYSPQAIMSCLFESMISVITWIKEKIKQDMNNRRKRRKIMDERNEKTKGKRWEDSGGDL